MADKQYQDLFTKEKKEFWLKNPLNGEVEIKLPFMNPFIMLCKNDDSVVKDLYWTDFKGWELTSLKIWHSLASQTQGTILDIGAYSGIYSIIASKSSTKSNIIAFDIQKKCIDRIKKNSSINKINNISCILSACSNSNQIIPFYFYEEKGILSSVASTKPKTMNDKTDSIKAINVDNYLIENNQNSTVQLIKIDIEGAEIDAILGLENEIKNTNPDIIIEINIIENIKHILKILPDRYTMYSIDDSENRIKKVGPLFKKFKNSRNFLATTKNYKSVEQLLL